jgi:GNAT superfamily N-acetyltransferase
LALAARIFVVRIRSITPKDIEPACHLIRETYRDFNYEEGTVDATNEYLDSYNPDSNLDSLRKRFRSTPICYVATEKKEVIGIVRGFYGRLVNLFVDGRYHRKGIGRKLLDQFERRCQEDGQDVIKTNISIFSIPFYEANGYKKTTGIRNQKGLKIQPMMKRLIG